MIVLDKRYINWCEVEQYVEEFAESNQYNEFSGVFGLPRGGLCLAVMLSHRLEIPLLSAPCEGCIIVDDICDSGETLLHYLRNSSGIKKNNYTITTMIYKPNKLVPENYLVYGFKEVDERWIVFPWEKID